MPAMSAQNWNDKQTKAIWHEAGHWFICEILGVPIRGYKIAQDGVGQVDSDAPQNAFASAAIDTAGYMAERLVDPNVNLLDGSFDSDLRSLANSADKMVAQVATWVRKAMNSKKGRARLREIASDMRQGRMPNPKYAYDGVFSARPVKDQLPGQNQNRDTPMGPDPPVSEPQRRAMLAAAHGESSIGIPVSVGKEFVGDDDPMAAFGDPGKNEPPSGPTQHQQNSDDLGPNAPTDFGQSSGRDAEHPRFSAQFGTQDCYGRARDGLDDQQVDVQGTPPTSDGYEQAVQGMPQVDPSHVAAIRAFLSAAGFDENECRAILHEYLAPPVHAPGGNDENIGGPEKIPGMPERGGGMAGDEAADDFNKMYPGAWPILMGGRSSDYDRMHEQMREKAERKRRQLASALAQDTGHAAGSFLKVLAEHRPRCIDTVDKATRLAQAMANQQVRSLHGRSVELAHDGATGPYRADKMRESAQLTATESDFEDFIKNGGKPIKWV
jgi:hypothetical protein